MAGFLSPLQLEYLDGHYWEVLVPFDYHIGAPDGIEHVIVPKGFITDFASIPRALWSVLSPTGSYGKAAVVHDFLYKMRIVEAAGLQPRLVERGEADSIFREAMDVLCVRRLTRWTVYSGVRMGGWVPWKKYRKEEFKVKNA